MKRITIFLLAIGLATGLMAQKVMPTNLTNDFNGELKEVSVDFIGTVSKANAVFYPTSFNSCASIDDPSIYVSEIQGYEFPVTGSNFLGFEGFAQKYNFTSNVKVAGVAAVMYRNWVGDDESLEASVYNADFSQQLKSTNFNIADIADDGVDLYEFNFPTVAEVSTFNVAITAPAYTETSSDLILTSTEMGCHSNLSQYVYVDLSGEGNPIWNDYADLFDNFNVDLMLFPILKDYVGLSSIELNNLSYVYPNPANNQVTIASSLNMEKVEIFNMVGQKVYEVNASGNAVSVDVSNFNTGTYVTKIHTDAGIATKKVIVR